MLSNKAYQMLAQVLTPKVIEQLYSSEEFIEFMHENIPAAIRAELGECDEDTLFELSMCVMDHIILKAV